MESAQDSVTLDDSMDAEQPPTNSVQDIDTLDGVVRMDQCALFLVHNGGVQTVENNNILDAPLSRVKR
jgi:hypothetical protein